MQGPRTGWYGLSFPAIVVQGSDAIQTALDLAVKHERAHCVTLLRLASHAQAEHPGNAMKHESFQQALQMFSTDLEDVLHPQEQTGALHDER
jgi:hypothetical protein